MKLKDLIGIIPYYGGVEIYDMRDNEAPKVVSHILL